MGLCSRNIINARAFCYSHLSWVLVSTRLLSQGAPYQLKIYMRPLRKVLEHFHTVVCSTDIQILYIVKPETFTSQNFWDQIAKLMGSVTKMLLPS